MEYKTKPGWKPWKPPPMVAEEEKNPPDKRPRAWKRLWARTGFGDKTLRDVLQLLIVPLVLVGIGLLFEMQQAEREEQRAKAERELADKRAQDEVLQAYLDQMNTLLLEHNLRNSKEDGGVRTLARARTLTVLERLDPSRKTVVMQFLIEAELVQRVEGGRGPIIPLTGANLRGADLHLVDLFGADLRDANLNDANLFGADLSETDLSGANLNDANLSEVNLRLADLSDARGVTGEQLKEQAQTLEGAIMPDGSVQPLTSQKADKAKFR